MIKLRIIRYTLFLVLGTGIQFVSGAQDKKGAPSIFQVTTAETLPGDAVLVRGEFLDKITGIRIVRLGDEAITNGLPSYVARPREDGALDEGGTALRFLPSPSRDEVSVRPLMQNSQSLKFIVPRQWGEGVYCVRLEDAAGGSSYFYLNTPKVNWVISEEGLRATAGDYLRIQGKNLSRKGGAAMVALVPLKGGNTVFVPVSKSFDDYSVQVTVPAGTTPGVYHLYYHNGKGGATAWSEPLKIEVVNAAPKKWEKKEFSVLAFGAKGDGVNDETPAFRAALDAAEQNGGGTVIVPKGRYMLTGELIIPPYTQLKGEARELTQVFWNPLNWDLGELPNSLITGSHHFAIRNLSMWASRAWGLIMLNGPIKEQGNVTLENISVQQSAELGGMVYQVKANRDKVESEINSRWQRTGIILRGENIIVRNCTFNSSGMYTFFAVSGFIQNSRFTRQGTGINQPYMMVHPKGLIFEDCYKQSDGYGYAASIDESRNLYEARNVIPYNYTNDREAMTLDGGSGAYAGPVAGVNGTLLTLPKGAETWQWTPDKWNGGGVFIIEGRGAGQFRRIVRHGLDSIRLDRPFLVDPDGSSVISITTVRQNLFFVNNEISDAGAYQFYGSSENCVLYGIKMKRCNGIVSRGSLLYHGKQPNWYIDIVNCELREGNYSHWFGINDRGHSGAQNINLIGSGGGGLNLGVLIRRNKLGEFSYIRTSPGGNDRAVSDVIIEDNSFQTAKTAISLGGTGTQTFGVLIHNNHYTDVIKNVDAQTLSKESYLILDDGRTSSGQ